MSREHGRRWENLDPKSVFEILGTEPGLIPHLPKDVLEESWKTLQSGITNKVHKSRVEEIRAQLALIERQIDPTHLESLRAGTSAAVEKNLAQRDHVDADLSVKTEIAPPEEALKFGGKPETIEDIRRRATDARFEVVPPTSSKDGSTSSTETPPQPEEVERRDPIQVESEAFADLTKRILRDIPENLRQRFEKDITALSERAATAADKPLSLQEQRTLWTRVINLGLEQLRGKLGREHDLAETVQEAFAWSIQSKDIFYEGKTADILSAITFHLSPEDALKTLEILEERFEDTELPEAKLFAKPGQLSSLEKLKQRVYKEVVDDIAGLESETRERGISLPSQTEKFPAHTSSETLAADLSQAISYWKNLRTQYETGTQVNPENPPVDTTAATETEPDSVVTESKAPAEAVESEPAPSGVVAENPDQLPTPPPFDESELRPVVSPAETTESGEARAETPEAARAQALAIIETGLRHSVSEDTFTIENLQQLKRSIEDQSLPVEKIWGNLGWAIEKVIFPQLETGESWKRSGEKEQELADALRECLQRQELGSQPTTNLKDISQPLSMLALIDSPEQALELYRQVEKKVAAGETQLIDDDTLAPVTLDQLLEDIQGQILIRTNLRYDLLQSRGIAVPDYPADLDQPFSAGQAEERIRSAAEYWNTLQTLSPEPAPVVPNPDTQPTGPAEPEAPEIPLSDNEPIPDLVEARTEYAVALRRRSKVFNATSNKTLEHLREQYQRALTEERTTKMDELKARFGTVDMSKAAEAFRVNGEIVKAVIQLTLEEESSFRLAAKDSAEKTRFEKFKGWWQKHSGKRLAVGVVLGVAGVTGIASGAGVIGGILLGTRVAMSAAGGFMSTEAGWQKLRDKWGAAKQYTPAEAQNLSDNELREAVSAQSFRFAEQGGVFEARRTGFRGKNIDQTAGTLMEELRRREEKKIRDQYKAGISLDTIISRSLSSSLDQELQLHRAYQERRQKDQKDARLKFALSAIVGTTMGVLTYDNATAHSLRSLLSKAQEGVPASAPEGFVPVKPSASTVENIVSAKPPTPTNEMGFIPVRPSIQEIPGGTLREAAAPDSSSVITDAIREQLGQSPDTTRTLSEAAADSLGQTPEAATQAVAETAVEKSVSSVETVKAGDSIWKLITHQLHERMGNDFDSLNEAQKTYLIDGIKDDIVTRPQDFGLENPNLIRVGQTIDFKTAFDGDHADRVTELLGRAKNLSEETMQQIEANNQRLSDWVGSHPGESLDSSKIDAILNGVPKPPTSVEELFGFSEADARQEYLEHMRQSTIRRMAALGDTTDSTRFLLPIDNTPAIDPLAPAPDTSSVEIPIESSPNGLSLDQEQLRVNMYRDLNTLNAQLGDSSQTVLKNIETMKVKDVVVEGKIREVVGNGELGSRVEKSMREFFRAISDTIIPPENTVKVAMEVVRKTQK